jgi:hypothetical protein
MTAVIALATKMEADIQTCPKVDDLVLGMEMFFSQIAA